MTSIIIVTALYLFPPSELYRINWLARRGKKQTEKIIQAWFREQRHGNELVACVP